VVRPAFFFSPFAFHHGRRGKATKGEFMKRLIVLAILAILLGCASSFSHRNAKLENQDPYSGRASLKITDYRGKEDVLVLLALSGGGSRAAYFSASVMLQLQTVYEDLDILQEVDAISSVSGGSMAAAYYVISGDPRDDKDSPLMVKARINGDFRLEALSADLRRRVTYDGKKKLLGVQPRLSAEDSEKIKAALERPEDSEVVDRLYLFSQIDVRSKRAWHPETVKTLMRRNYTDRWIANWFWPYNIVRYWFTAYDRSDIMAQTLADNIYDVRHFTRDLQFQDIHPERPYIIINATNATRDPHNEPFAYPFTFTHEDFRDIKSNINTYKIAWAVMGSAAFPSVFNYVTLRNFNYTSEEEKRFVHVFDGGMYDNLGLETLSQVIADIDNECEHKSNCKYRNIIVILVDAYTRPRGIDPAEDDPRSLISYVVDFNFLDAVDGLLASNREKEIAKFKKMEEERGNAFIFWHISFQDIRKSDLKKDIDKIPTNFRILDSDANKIDEAVQQLVSPSNSKLQHIRKILQE
jgi:predicted acylesterase/phospholipase RssA